MIRLFIFSQIFAATFLAHALELVSTNQVPVIFGGEPQLIELALHNPENKAVEEELRIRIHQLTSATTAPIAESTPWKTLRILPQQTVVEKMNVTVPEVRALTDFQIQLLNKNEKLIGTIAVRAAPRTLLKNLQTSANAKPIGVLDPENILKPLLRTSKVEFHDLEKNSGFDDFTGSLVLLGPFRSGDAVPANLRERIMNATKTSEKPLGIVWMQPPGTKPDQLLPLYFVRENNSTIAILQNHVVADLAQSAQSQLNLLRAANLAAKPEFSLPKNEP